MFKKTYVKQFHKPSVPASNEALYWKKFSKPILMKEDRTIVHIDISPVEPYFIAVTCSLRVQLYHPITRVVHKNYNRFKDSAYGGTFRKDGKLILAGGEENAVKLFDVSSKNLLRVFKGHQRAVHKCAFLPTDNHIVSFSDDKTVIQWDIPTEKIIHKYEGHVDYVRGGQVCEANPNLIISGSYDHTVKVWDKREKKEVMSVMQETPVEAVLVSGTGSLLYSAGADIKVWDILAGGRLLSKLSSHVKTITTLGFSNSGNRLISGSLDRNLKIYDVSSYETLHTIGYSSSIMCAGTSRDDSTLVVGMIDGIFAISRKEEISSKEAGLEFLEESKKVRNSKKYMDFEFTSSGIRENLGQDQPKYDKYLRSFRYTRALDEVLTFYYCHKSPEVTVSVLQELIRRDGLKTALAGRNSKSLTKVLVFLIKNLRKTRFMRILLHVANDLVDIYASKVGEDSQVDKLFLRLYEEIERETSYVKELMVTQGAIELILSGRGTAGEGRTDNASSREPILKLEPSDAAKETLVCNL